MKILRKIGRYDTRPEGVGVVAIYNAIDHITYYEKYEEVYDVAIGEGSKRKWMLMNEDGLNFRFSCERNLTFKVGDFVWFEGRRFVLTKPYHPSDNAESGGYDYDIPFEIDYYLGRNRKFKLSGKELSWSLTSTMDNHLKALAERMKEEGITYRELADNPQVVGYDILEKYYTYDIQAYTPEGGDPINNTMKSITYSGFSLLESITKIAETWKCEWWFDEETLTMGKCEVGEDYVDFHRDYLDGVKPNIESIDGQGQSEGYATRLYVYGSKDNLPARYDRKLIFEQSSHYSSGSHTRFIDNRRRLTPDMFPINEHNTWYPNPQTKIQVTFSYTDLLPENVLSIPIPIQSTNDISLDATIGGIAGINTYAQYKVVAKVYSEDKSKALTITSDIINRDEEGHYSFTFQDGGVLLCGSHLYIELTALGGEDGSFKTLEDFELYDFIGTFTLSSRKVQISTKVDFGNGEVDCVINFRQRDESEVEFSEVRVATSDYVNSNFKFPYIADFAVPIEYYSSDNNSQIGYSERRLHMDSSDEVGDTYIKHGTYIQAKGVSDDEVVEEMLIIDDVCPNIRLKVVGVDHWTKEEKNEQGELIATHIYYDIRVEKADGGSFTFSTKSILEGSKLRARFLGNIDPTQNALLNGYDFDMGFYPNGRDGLKDYQEFEIVNGTSGNVEIPNAVLLPQIGDQFVLYGWDTQSLDTVNALVESAALDLKNRAVEYLNKSRIDANTYTCPMFSDVENQYPIGQKVKLYSPLFAGGVRNSRIVGGEFNLDLPWDTPVYTIAQEVSYSSSLSVGGDVGAVQNLIEAPYVLPITGNTRRPVFVNGAHAPQVIEGLDVPEDIHSEKDIHADGGVAAKGITDLSMIEGGGGQGATSVEIDPDTHYAENEDYEPVDGKVKLPSYKWANIQEKPAIPNVVGYNSMDDAMAEGVEDLSKAASAKSVAILKRRLDYESLPLFSTETDYYRGDCVKTEDGFGIVSGWRFVADKTAGEWIGAYVEPLNAEALATPLDIPLTTLNNIINI